MQEKCRSLRQRICDGIRDLEGANPRAILARGYSVVRDAETGKIIRSPEDTQTGRLIEISPASGKITARTELVQTEKQEGSA